MYYLCQAIVPFYDDYGHNMTYTLLSDGTKSTYCFPIKNYIYRMFYQLYLDPVAVRNCSSRILHSKVTCLSYFLRPTFLFPLRCANLSDAKMVLSVMFLLAPSKAIKMVSLLLLMAQLSPLAQAIPILLIK